MDSILSDGSSSPCSSMRVELNADSSSWTKMTIASLLNLGSTPPLPDYWSSTSTSTPLTDNSPSPLPSFASNSSAFPLSHTTSSSCSTLSNWSPGNAVVPAPSTPPGLVTFSSVAISSDLISSHSSSTTSKIKLVDLLQAGLLHSGEVLTFRGRTAKLNDLGNIEAFEEKQELRIFTSLSSWATHLSRLLDSKKDIHVSGWSSVFARGKRLDTFRKELIEIRRATNNKKRIGSTVEVVAKKIASSKQEDKNVQQVQQDVESQSNSSTPLPTLLSVVPSRSLKCKSLKQMISRSQLAYFQKYFTNGRRLRAYSFITNGKEASRCLTLSEFKEKYHIQHVLSQEIYDATCESISNYLTKETQKGTSPSFDAASTSLPSSTPLYALRSKGYRGQKRKTTSSTSQKVQNTAISAKTFGFLTEEELRVALAFVVAKQTYKNAPQQLKVMMKELPSLAPSGTSASLLKEPEEKQSPDTESNPWLRDVKESLREEGIVDQSSSHSHEALSAVSPLHTATQEPLEGESDEHSIIESVVRTMTSFSAAISGFASRLGALRGRGLLLEKRERDDQVLDITECFLKILVHSVLESEESVLKIKEVLSAIESYIESHSSSYLQFRLDRIISSVLGEAFEKLMIAKLSSVSHALHPVKSLVGVLILIGKTDCFRAEVLNCTCDKLFDVLYQCLTLDLTDTQELSKSLPFKKVALCSDNIFSLFYIIDNITRCSASSSFGWDSTSTSSVPSRQSHWMTVISELASLSTHISNHYPLFALYIHKLGNLFYRQKQG